MQLARRCDRPREWASDKLEALEIKGLIRMVGINKFGQRTWRPTEAGQRVADERSEHEVRPRRWA